MYPYSCVCVRYNQEIVQTCQKDSLSLVTVLVLRPETYNTECLCVLDDYQNLVHSPIPGTPHSLETRLYDDHLIFILVVLFQLTIICTNSLRVKSVNVSCSTPVPSPRGT